MRREATIPLFLWVATAIVAHLTWGGGADRVSNAIEERLDIRRFALAVRERARGGGTTEIALLDDATAPDEQRPEVPKPEAQPSDTPDQHPDEPDPEHDHHDDTQHPIKVEPKRAEPKPAPKEQPRPEPPKAEPPKPAEPKPPEPLPDVPLRGRVAVQQHVEDKQQPDNPNAEFLGDQANHVREQTQSRNTSTDQNDPNPTPGAASQGGPQQPGNASEDKVAQSDDHAGERRAPDPTPASTAQSTPGKTDREERAVARASREAAAGKHGSRSGADGSTAKALTPGQTGQREQRASEQKDSSPAVVSSDAGDTKIAKEQAGQEAQKGRKARKKRLPPPKGRRDAMGLLGLGALGLSPGGMNLNLTPSDAVAVAGRDKLAEERRADAERRKSAHRGSWKPVGLERWRAAIENYVAHVKPGNQTALNTARVPFATYLNVIHQRLHPIFADSFLASLDNLPGSHPLNGAELRTTMEIAVSREDGSIVDIGITRNSGVTAFDVGALQSVYDAAPFGAPPPEIVSPDGNVYLHWEFYRNPMYACSTYFARPYILKGKPKGAPTKRPKTTEPPPEGRTGRAPTRSGDRRVAAR